MVYIRENVGGILSRFPLLDPSAAATVVPTIYYIIIIIMTTVKFNDTEIYNNCARACVRVFVYYILTSGRDLFALCVHTHVFSSTTTSGEERHVSPRYCVFVWR